MVPPWVTEAKLFGEPGEGYCRLISDLGGGLLVRIGDKDQPAQLSGRFRRAVQQDAAPKPAVGDYLAYSWLDDQDRAQISGVVERRSAIKRKSAGETAVSQTLVANVDSVFIVMALNEDYNLRRLERFLAVVWDGGATPVVVLTKADLCDNAVSLSAEAQAVSPGATVLATSTVSRVGLDQIAAMLEAGKTYALLGSSGVGKSTLVNAWLGEARMETKEIRDDGKGRHTTTHRQLIALQNGAYVIDTPGMRELGMLDVEAGVRETFSDVEGFAAQCRFSDCQHDSEPGCAVRESVESGALPRERFESFQKLLREIAARNANENAETRAARKRQTKVAQRAFNKTKR